MTATRRSTSPPTASRSQDRADRAIFAGNVEVRQGELTLDTARLTLAYASERRNRDQPARRQRRSDRHAARAKPRAAISRVYDLDDKLITHGRRRPARARGLAINGARLMIDLDSGPRGDGRRPARRRARAAGGSPAASPCPSAQQFERMNDAALFDGQLAQPAATVRGLEVRSIAKSYDKRAVLHDVSLHVERGEVVGLLGPNGAGKTTCFYSVMGLVKPDAGRILLDGAGHHPAADVPPRDPRPWLSAAGNLDLPRPDGRAEHHVGARGRRARPQTRATTRLEQLLDEFGLTAFARFAGDGAVGRRAAALRDRPRAGRRAVDHAARRAVRRDRPDFDRRHPRAGAAN